MKRSEKLSRRRPLENELLGVIENRIDRLTWAGSATSSRTKRRSDKHKTGKQQAKVPAVRKAGREGINAVNKLLARLEEKLEQKKWSDTIVSTP